MKKSFSGFYTKLFVYFCGIILFIDFYGYYILYIII